MDDAYAYAEPDSQEHADQGKQIARCVSKLKGSSRHSQLRVLAGLLEQLPQDLGALGSAKAREVLLESLSDRAILHSKQKDVRMYASACFAQLLRIYAPETPYDDKQLEVRLAAGLEPATPTSSTTAPCSSAQLAAAQAAAQAYCPCCCPLAACV
jgi:sister-chromatid-cohesion protein PDS5